MTGAYGFIGSAVVGALKREGMRDLAEGAAASDAPALPPSYHRLARLWFWLGWPAFLSVLAIFWLMIAKPA